MINKRIMLVGGAGFIGHNLAIKLHDLGADVLIVDSLQVNNIGSLFDDFENNSEKIKVILSRFEIISKLGIKHKTVDARNYHELSKVVRDYKPNVVIHLAAVSHANRSNKDPHSTFDHNLRTLENSLDICKGNVDQFIFFSSSMVYGNFEEEFVTEESKTNPLGIYGNLKLAGEMIVKSYCSILEVPYTIIRPSALYGPRCISGRVLQQFIEKLLNGEEITIHGDGEEKLDFTYIDDLVAGTCLCIGNKKAYNEVFNLTYGSSRRIIEGLRLICSLLDLEVKYSIKPRDKMVPFRGTLSVEKAKKLLNYLPIYNLENGLSRYVDYYTWEK